MGRIVTTADVFLRYIELGSIFKGTDFDLAFIEPAEIQIEGILGQRFTVPFSSNNSTAKDLVIDQCYCRALITKRPKSVVAIQASIDKRIKDLLSGKAAMVTTSGDLLSRQTTPAWSSTMGYTPPYGMVDTMDTEIDQDQIDDELDSRDNI